MADFMNPTGGWGTSLLWDPVPNATAYRVYRKTTLTTPGSLLATLTVAEATWQPANAMAAADPDVDWMPTNGQVSGLGYWVEAVFADGSVSGPGPFATPKAAMNSTPLFIVPLTIPNLKVTVSGTRTGTFNGQKTPGSDVTWTWDQMPTLNTYVYHVAIILPPSTSQPFAPPQVMDTRMLRSPDPAPIHLMTSVTTVGPPLTIFYPTGITVGACVAPLDIGRILMAGQPLPVGVSCASIQVP